MNNRTVSKETEPIYIPKSHYTKNVFYRKADFVVLNSPQRHQKKFAARNILTLTTQQVFFICGFWKDETKEQEGRIRERNSSNESKVIKRLASRSR